MCRFGLDVCGGFVGLAVASGLDDEVAEEFAAGALTALTLKSAAGGRPPDTSSESNSRSSLLHPIMPRSIRSAWGDDAGFVGENHDLNSVAKVQLGQDAGDVGLDGGLADDESAGDLLV
jgi:hypothetical protein